MLCAPQKVLSTRPSSFSCWKLVSMMIVLDDQTDRILVDVALA